MDLQLFLTSKISEYGEKNVGRYLDLYINIQPPELTILFSRIHFELDGLLLFLNKRNPNSGGNGHYLADYSRELIKWIDELFELERTLCSTTASFTIDQTYYDAITSCRSFLSESGGCEIPSTFSVIILTKYNPIFILQNTVELKRADETIYQNITPLGSGSYATTYKFYDPFYDHWFALKKAKPDLNEKEYQRFEREFNTMKKLNSPYIVEVYAYNDKKKEYIMELLDTNLYNYIQDNQLTLSADDRMRLVIQILKAFEYLESKHILHRDISYTNILIKKYEHVPVIKIADFGLVKTQESQLSSIGSEYKGSLNDPSLIQDGFENYKHHHEIYALTRIVYFVISGNTDISSCKNGQLKTFVEKGMNANPSIRYKTIIEMRKEITQITNKAIKP